MFILDVAFVRAFEPIQELRAFRFRDGTAGHAYVLYGRSGCISIRLRSGRGHRVYRVPLPSEVWPDSVDSRTWPVAIPATLGGAPCLLLVLHQVSGVYGYRGVWVLRLGDVVHGQAQLREPMFEFSDFGSFRLNGSTFTYWDADLNEPPHEGAHRFVMVTLSYGSSTPQVSSRLTTKRRYDPGWDPSGHRPRMVLPSNDPLREFGLRWCWWGELLRSSGS